MLVKRSFFHDCLCLKETHLIKEGYIITFFYIRQDGLFQREVTEWELKDKYLEREDNLASLRVRNSILYTIFLDFRWKQNLLLKSGGELHLVLNENVLKIFLLTDI